MVLKLLSHKKWLSQKLFALHVKKQMKPTIWMMDKPEKHLNSENPDLAQWAFVLEQKVIQWHWHSINIQWNDKNLQLRTQLNHNRQILHISYLIKNMLLKEQFKTNLHAFINKM